MDDLLVALALEDRRREPRPLAAAAHGGDRAPVGNLAETVGQLPVWDVERTGDVPRLELAGIADVEHRDGLAAVEPGGQIVRVDLLDPADLAALRAPGRHP